MEFEIKNPNSTKKRVAKDMGLSYSTNGRYKNEKNLDSQYIRRNTKRRMSSKKVFHDLNFSE